MTKHQQQSQNNLLIVTPRKKKESSSPWWDVFSPCKEAASDSEAEDNNNEDVSYNHHYDMYTNSPTISVNDNPIKAASAPVSPAGKLTNNKLQSPSSLEAEKDSRQIESLEAKELLFFVREENNYDDAITTIEPLENDNAREEESEENENELLPSEEEAEGNVSPSFVATINQSATDDNTADGTDELLAEAPVKINTVDEEDESSTKITVSLDDGDVAVTADDRTITAGNVPQSALNHHQLVGPRLTVEEYLLSRIKLPLRVVSILMSAWISIIILRVLLIISLMLVDGSKLLEGGDFNSPGIY